MAPNASVWQINMTKTSMAAVAILAIAIALVAFVYGADVGKGEGYMLGVQGGYESGYADGVTSGELSGQAKGEANGHVEGYAVGYVDAWHKACEYASEEKDPITGISTRDLCRNVAGPSLESARDKFYLKGIIDWPDW